MQLKHLYLILAILGTIIPLWPFTEFLIEYGFNLDLMFRLMWVNEIASFFTWDVVISSFVVIVFIISESMKLKIKNFWIYILFNRIIGVSLGLPAFLYARAMVIEKIEIKVNEN